jgi:hypothetical protein
MVKKKRGNMKNLERFLEVVSSGLPRTKYQLGGKDRTGVRIQWVEFTHPDITNGVKVGLSPSTLNHKGWERIAHQVGHCIRDSFIGRGATIYTN